MSPQGSAQDQGSASLPPSLETMEAFDKPWGHNLVSQPSDTFRIGLLNPGGIPIDLKNAKSTLLRQFITKTKMDVIGLIETNVNWRYAPINQRLPERTRGWWENIHLNSACYENYNNPQPAQPGGVSLWSINKGAHRVMEQGKDLRGLGRWAWTRYRGKGGVNLRYVAAYRPVLNKTGIISVWSQQRGYFDSINDDRCPRDIFTDDLCKEIVQWLETGDQLIIGLDANEDVRNGSFSARLQQLGLQETIIAQHGNEAPATYIRGNTPIDGLYVSRSLRGLKCGYLPFHDQFDHRLLWIDIPLTIAFGHNISEVVKVSARRLKCEDPRIVKKYQENLKRYLLQYNMLEEARWLQRRACFPCNEQHEFEYNLLDSIRFEAMMEADRRCRKLSMGAIPYTPAYSAVRTKIELWTLVIKKLKGGNVDSRFLQRKAKKAKIVDPLSRSIQDARDRRGDAYREEKRLAKKAGNDRKTWMESLVEARAADGNLSQAQELKNLLSREEQRRVARIIRRVNGKLRSGSLTSVVAPNSNGEWVEVTDKREIEKSLMKENERRFNQARNTPFLKPPLLDLVGRRGTGPAAEAILRGEFQIPEGTDHWAAKLIPHLARPFGVKASVSGRPGPITVDSHCSGWLKAKERTSAGKSGITFAHFKAGAKEPWLAEFESIMTSIPYETGLSPSRWQQGVNVMLEKKKGNRRVDKLRAILLYEADFNQNNKKIGREMMYYAEDLHLIAKEQYGSRKNLSAVDHSLNKTLTYDLIRQRKIPGAVCSNDAKSCYDRIVHSVASLAMQRMGMEQAPIVCMFTTIQNLDHYIRTVYGNSELSFSGKLWTVPIQGVGQGNGAGPQIWAVVSTPVLNMLRAEGYGAFFEASISHEKMSFVGYAFVDDTDLVVTAKKESDTFREVAVAMQGSLSAWEGGICATGGAIEPSKSHWYLIDFTWHNGHWRYSTIEETPAELQVKDCDGTVCRLQRLSVKEAQQTLGVRIAPDGNNDAELLFLRERVDTWADCIRTGHLPRNLAWESMSTTILKSLQYPLPATTLTEQQCALIMSPLLQAGLPSSGIVRTIPRALVLGPKYYQGLGFPCLFTYQQADHVERLMKYCMAEDNMTGQLLRQSIESTKLEIGCNGPLLGQSFKHFGILATPTWVTKTWEFLDGNGMRMEDTCQDFSSFRENDSFLMPAFLEAGFHGAALKRLNLCRLYLQAVSVGELSTGCGRFIAKSVWQGNFDTTRRSRYAWPRQGKPAASEWIFWREALAKTFCGRNMVLRQPLGRWLSDGSDSWEWFYAPNEERLYKKGNGINRFYPRVAGVASRAAVLRFRDPEDTVDIPVSAMRATVAFQASTVVLTGFASTLCEALSEVSPSSLRQWIEGRGVHSNAKWAVKDFVASDNGAIVAEAILQGTCTGVCDGSFKNEFGTACWTIQSDTGPSGQIYGPCVAPGNPSDQNAYRSELTGLYGMAIMIEAICKFHSVTQGKVEIGCDGLQALRNATHNTDIINPKYPHFDLIAATRAAMRRCKNIEWKSRHVKGHQDDDEDAQLDSWAKLNIEMDGKAKEHWYRTNQREEPQQCRIFGEPWALWIDGKKISQRVRESIIEQRQGKDCLRYWDKKRRFGQGTTVKIDWEATGKAMHSISRTRQQWVTKHVSGFCGTGKMMMRWKKRDTAKCPRCDEENENATHVWKCQGSGANEVWNGSIEKLKNWMRKQKTQPNLAELICDRLSAWRCGTIPGVQPASYRGIRAALVNQDEVGWQAMLEGAPAIGWREIQQSYYEWLGIRKTGLRWLSALVQKLWDVAWDQWNHRNGILHDNDETLSTLLQDRQIREQYLLGASGLTRDGQIVFCMGLVKTLKLGTELKTAWLIRIRESRQRKQRQRENPGQAAYTQERQAMGRWLARSGS